MKLYHGSFDTNIKDFKIIARKNNTPEYGRGVYFTTNKRQAKIRSCSKSDTGAVYEVDINLEELNGKNVKNDELSLYLSCLNRIDLEELVEECLDELEGVDYIYGKVLRNIYDFKINAEKFNDGDIELEEFKKATKWFGKKYNQYCFKTKKALDLLNSHITNVFYTKREKGKIVYIDKSK